ncbi:SpaA isopeptide-forming pilin-related protein [Clostridium perfringens]|uniref:SpaA isopeptide-forming pilin-related protein n=1 Tax=Clostridium perfringens TaxID=1502 RepID=UPI003CFADCBE
MSKVILLGCPYNIKGYKGELSDLEFQEVTQIAIWQLTDPSINLKDKLPEKSKIVFDKIFKNLDNIKIPSNFSLKLYNYKGGDNYQNFISPYIDESEIPKIPEEPAKTIEVSKVNLGGQEITGAQIQIKNENGDVVTSWTSEEGKTKTLDLVPGTYIFHEEAAPNGYLAVNDIKFTVGKDGNITVVEVNKDDKVVAEGNKLIVTDKDAPKPEEPAKTIEISKVNLGGQEIAGAQIQVKNENGDVVTSWTSEERKTKTLDLVPGTYIFHEEAAPNGYLAVNDIKFTVGKYGSITVVEVNKDDKVVAEGNKLIVTDKDAPKPEEPAKTIEISKVNLGGQEIAGAQIQVKNENGDVVTSWTSEEGKTKILDLVPGTYIFHEEAAPNGYLVVNDIKFTVGKDGSITVVEVNKDDKVSAEGNKLIVTDKDAPKPEEPTKTIDANNNVKNNNANNPKVQNKDNYKEKQLPKTGEKMSNKIYIGFIVLGFGLLGLIQLNKKKKVI